jgi:N-acylglucosamine 2-epimerase
MNFKALADQYRDELLNRVLPFWESYSVDKEYGGYFTCLRGDGTVFDTDKFVWLQARQVWTFAMLYNRLEPKAAWLALAKHGADFLEKHGRDEAGDWYFSLTREGKPIIQAYNIFSDCFATMAFGQLYVATGEERYATIAKATFERILERKNNPKGHYNKAVPGTRPLKNFALPMILCNLCLEIEALLDKSLVERIIADCIHEVMEVFYHEPSGLILENVTPDGAFSDTFEGRLLNPGHAIEAMWFIMDLGQRNGDQQLIETACERMIKMLEYGWDETYDGILYFLDFKGHPPQQLEWDQKLWWVHLETLVGLTKGYELTGNEACRQWFEKVHTYTWAHFRGEDSRRRGATSETAPGEWWGYLNRRGEKLLDLKGGKWKGCFHVPRGLFQCWQTLNRLARRT